MSRIDGKCDNPDCRVDIKEGEGDYWITGAYLCPKCKKEWSDRYEKVVKNALRMDGEENKTENKEDEKKKEKSDEHSKKKIVKVQSKLF